MRVTTSQYEISGKNHICSVKTFLPEHILSISEKKFIGTSNILAWGKSRVLPTTPPFYTIKFFTQNSREELKLVSGFSFTCNKYPSQFTDDKSNDSSLREGIPLDALNWFGRGYELHTRPWRVLPAASRLCRMGWFSRTLACRMLQIPEEKWGLLVVYPNTCYINKLPANS